MNQSTHKHAAFVSGAGRNIGRSVVLDLARRGYDVVINGRRDRELCDAVAAEAKALGVETLVLMGDVGTAVDIDRMAKEALARFGTIDVLVNNAALRPEKPTLEMTDEDWYRVLDVDLTAAFRLSRAFLPGMVDRGWGRIVNFAGMNAMQGYAGRAHVSVAKHGVWGLTKALAREFGPKGITVNTVSPGPIRPDIAEEHTRQHIEGMVGRIPLGRMGENDEVAAVVGMLCSDDGAYVSGQMIAVNGAGSM